MEARQDRYWLLGEPGWWGLGETMPPEFRTGELPPPEGWVSTTPRVGNFGWCRQRLRPLAWPLLRPMAWAPLFLATSAIPLALPGRTPFDQALAVGLFAISWSLVFFPILFARNSQPMSAGGLLSLPVDTISLGLAAAVFPLHFYYHPMAGWVSYALCWVAYFRTVMLVQAAMLVPPARFLLPVEPSDWEPSLQDPWERQSGSWGRKEIASAPTRFGRLVISGTSRSGQDFLSLAFVHSSGFVQDPFHEGHDPSSGVQEALESPIPISGLQWPSNFLVHSEEE